MKNNKSLDSQIFVNAYIGVLITIAVWLLINMITTFFWQTELTDSKTLLMILIVIVENVTYQRYRTNRSKRNLIAFILANMALVAILVIIGI